MRNTAERIPQFVDTGDKYGFNLGFVAHVEQWDIGLITSYFAYPDLQTPLVDVDNDGLDDSFPGDYKAATYETVLSLNYRF